MVCVLARVAKVQSKRKLDFGFRPLWKSCSSGSYFGQIVMRKLRNHFVQFGAQMTVSAHGCVNDGFRTMYCTNEKRCANDCANVRFRSKVENVARMIYCESCREHGVFNFKAVCANGRLYADCRANGGLPSNVALMTQLLEELTISRIKNHLISSVGVCFVQPLNDFWLIYESSNGVLVILQKSRKFITSTVKAHVDANVCTTQIFRLHLFLHCLPD